MEHRKGHIVHIKQLGVETPCCRLQHRAVDSLALIDRRGPERFWFGLISHAGAPSADTSGELEAAGAGSIPSARNRSSSAMRM